MNDAFRRRTATLLMAAGLSTVLLTAPAAADANPYERGPAPTEASITAGTGPFEVASVSVPGASGLGFGGGTIYHPKATGQGTFAPIVVTPGFIGPQFSIAWYGPRLASQGFVVMTISTNAPMDVPPDRAKQMLAALDYLTQKSAVKDRVDASRPGLMGHSMGGGGTIRAAAERPEIKAAIPLAPWDPDASLARPVKANTLIIGADMDFIAPVSMFSEPMYAELQSAPEKAYLELNNAGHVISYIAPNTTIAKYSIAWMKRFLDNDTRYDQFLCPPPKPSSAIKEYRDTCSLG
ncbi:alpha/beta hydrolase [Actinomadura fulvescens]|uniref:Poly(ethylene terephthalate) hydrolase n=1 Tax=Actinomadura fulvescens TaxID=46160 RepID=A0ABP6BRL7_9ACTN